MIWIALVRMDFYLCLSSIIRSCSLGIDLDLNKKTQEKSVPFSSLTTNEIPSFLMVGINIWCSLALVSDSFLCFEVILIFVVFSFYCLGWNSQFECACFCIAYSCTIWFLQGMYNVSLSTLIILLNSSKNSQNSTAGLQRRVVSDTASNSVLIPLGSASTNSVFASTGIATVPGTVASGQIVIGNIGKALSI